MSPLDSACVLRPPRPFSTRGSDTGNFLGTAIYVQGQEAVLVCEMEAGWYRYVSEWRLHANGTIRPRFGFSAVSSSCVCNVASSPCVLAARFRHPHCRQQSRPRVQRSSAWLVQVAHEELRNPAASRSRASAEMARRESSTGQGYEIVPGPDDGVATAAPDWPFSKGDVWILRYRGSRDRRRLGCHRTAVRGRPRHVGERRVGAEPGRGDLVRCALHS